MRDDRMGPSDSAELQVEQIESAWRRRHFEDLRRVLRRMRAFALSRGYAGLSRAAQTLETSVAEGRIHVDVMQPLVYALREALTSCADPDGLGEPGPGPVYVIDADAAAGEDLCRQLRTFGYEARRLASLDEAPTAVAVQEPCAIVMDVQTPGDSLALTDGIMALQKRRPIPIVYASARGDLAARLQALRCGGAGYLLKPIDIGELVETLDRITGLALAEPFRILVVDDDAIFARATEAVLREAGMTTASCGDPSKALPMLSDFRPDLLLLDLTMAGCTGIELAQVIRQQEIYAAMPIVFMTEGGDDRQSTLLRKGGDDILRKPIAPTKLVGAVRARAERMRMVRALTMVDGHTRLLNHSASIDALEREVALARRNLRTLSFAMIDVDDFKSVNDTQGHSAGDRVLKSLARIIRQRVRRTDIVGRYGGEEFCIVLPDTKRADGARVVDEIRREFEAVPHLAPNGRFRATFSAGVAEIEGRDAAAIIEAADDALYEAKGAGKNRVVIG